MQVHDPHKLLEYLRSQDAEREWLEFKQNNFTAKAAGEYISALANSAALAGKDCAYLVYGVENGSHEIVGTTVRLETETVGSETFLFWVSKMLSPSPRLEVVQFDVRGMHVEMLLIEPSYQQPVKFQSKAFVRVDSSIRALQDYPDRERALWLASSRYTFEDAVAFPNKSAAWVLSSTTPSVIVDGLGIGRATTDGVIDLLVSEGMLHDNFQGGLDATNLLGITIAKQLADWPALASKAPRVVAYKGASNQAAEKILPERLVTPRRFQSCSSTSWTSSRSGKRSSTAYGGPSSISQKSLSESSWQTHSYTKTSPIARAARSSRYFGTGFG